MKIELTKAQVQAILQACGNTTEHPDAMIATFGNRREVNTCIRGINRLREAVGQSTHREWSEEEYNNNQKF